MRILSALSVLLLCVGCSYQQRGNSEWGFKQSTSWSFYQVTEPANPNQVSELKVNMQFLEDSESEETNTDSDSVD